MATLKFVAFLILLALVALFTFQNTEPVTLRFLFLTKAMSLSLLLLGFLFAGIIVGWLFSFITFTKKNGRDDDLKTL